MSYEGKNPTYKNVTETAPKNLAIAALDVDWSKGEAHYKDIAADSTFTFSNDVNGKSILIIINNTDTNPHDVTWPAGFLSDSSYSGTINAGTESVFNFVKSNNKIYLSSVKGLS